MPDRVKEKLVELQLKADLEDEISENTTQHREYIADLMIAHGVTVTPIKVGDTVYTNLAMRGWYFRKNDRPYSARVCFIGLNNSEEMGGGFFNVVYGKHESMMQFRFSDIGKSVFISKEEAEAALPQPPKE